MVWPMIYRVRLGGDQDTPILQEYLWEDLPHWVRRQKHHTISGMHRNCQDEDMRCFYSGVLMYLSNSDNQDYAPWEASRDHLVSVRNQGKGQGGSNIVFTGRLLNSKLGHTPLPVKLFARQYLKACEYNRSEPTYQTFRQIANYLQEFENSLKIGGKYPWQPWAYSEDDPNAQKASEFYDELRKIEDEFLALPQGQRRDWVDRFSWRW